MAKKKTKQTVRTVETLRKGEQMDLIDVGPANLKAMRPVAAKCKNAEKRRAKAADEKKAAHAEMAELAKEAKLKPNAKGFVEFVVDGLRVKVDRGRWKTVSVTETQ